MSDFLDDLIVLGGSRLPGDAKRAKGQFPSSFDNFDHSCRRVSSICKTGNLQLLQTGSALHRFLKVLVVHGFEWSIVIVLFQIVTLIENQLNKVKKYRLPIMYLIDSIIKEFPEDYVPIFSKNLVQLFADTFKV